MLDISIENIMVVFVTLKEVPFGVDTLMNQWLLMICLSVYQ